VFFMLMTFGEREMQETGSEKKEKKKRKKEKRRYTCE
jgi:hypothetical protein